MSQLWAVEGDPNSHGGGDLIASNPKTVYINNISVIEHEDPANADSLCDSDAHCSPSTSSGSSTVFVYGNPVHRNGDSRVCGATTIVNLQNTVFCG
jgi:uncharacterized Zn-binding protein involved in type VI secretion